MISTVFIWDIGLNIRSNKNPDGISKGWLCASRSRREESNIAGGWLHSSCLNADYSSSDVCATMMSLWKRSCGSTWTSCPSILIDDFVLRMTTWSFRLKVCSSLVSNSIDFSVAAPTECAVSTLTVWWHILQWQYSTAIGYCWTDFAPADTGKLLVCPSTHERVLLCSYPCSAPQCCS